ncbi:MAG: chemotaxis protein CheW [Gemmatimonadota bacterium]|mgnify:CR=1 FL=1|nr:chemotaxis protein CheW [Gemmatimonadota bacterium]
MSDNRQLCTFYLHDLFFGVDVVEVQEVIRAQKTTRVPLAAPAVNGLINLRGQIVTALDLRIQLGLPPRADGEVPMNVVVRTPEGPVSLLVDRIGDVIEISEDLFAPLPETVDERMREVVDGVYKIKDRLLLALKTDVVTQISDTGAAA